MELIYDTDATNSIDRLIELKQLDLEIDDNFFEDLMAKCKEQCTPPPFLRRGITKLYDDGYETLLHSPEESCLISSEDHLLMGVGCTVISTQKMVLYSETLNKKFVYERHITFLEDKPGFIKGILDNNTDSYFQGFK